MSNFQSVFCDLFVPASCRFGDRNRSLDRPEDENENGNFPLKHGTHNPRHSHEQDSSNSSGRFKSWLGYGAAIAKR